MNASISVFTATDLYEVLIREGVIVRVTKFIGDSQIPRDIEWEDVPPDVVSEIIAQLVYEEPS